MRAVLMRTGVALVLHGATPAVTEPASPEWTPFQLAGQGGIVVQATLNGVGPFVFLLDTGSTHSSISEQLAERIGAPLVAKALVGSAMGAVMRPIARVDRLDLGPTRCRDVLPSLLASDALATIGHVDGVIGQDVLAPLRYTIDFANRRLLWLPRTGDDPPPAPGFAMEARQGRFVVRLPQGGTTLTLVPDSGAASLLLFRQPDRPLPAMSLASAPAELATLSRRGQVRQAVVHELRVGRTTLHDVPAVVVEPTGSPPEDDGLLPLHLFDRVTFDGPRGLLIVEKAGA